MTDEAMSAGQKVEHHTLTATDFLTLARIVGYVVAMTAGLALGLGSYNDIVASDGPANFLLPAFIAVAVAGGLAAGWHVAFSMGAHALSDKNKIIAFAIGIGLAITGFGTSGWFLTSKIGGARAIQTHQSVHLEKLQRAERVVAANNSLDGGILQNLESAAGRGGSGFLNS